MTGRKIDGRHEFARRLRAYMGYADRTLHEVAQSLSAAGIPASASTVNRWSRGQSVPNIVAAQALGRLVEEAGMTPTGEGVAWLLGNRPTDLGSEGSTATPSLDRAVRDWQFHTASPALAQALAERGVPAPYRKPLADLLAQLLAEVELDQPDSPVADKDAAG